MGLEGVVELDKFVKSGGSADHARCVQFLPGRLRPHPDVEATRTSAQFYAPGPMVEMEIQQQSNPIFYGYTAEVVPVRYAGGPLLRVPQDDSSQVGAGAVSGHGEIGAQRFDEGRGGDANRPAIVDVPVGQGHVILFATNPCYRWQNLGEFNMLANAILYQGSLDPAGMSACARRICRPGATSHSTMNRPAESRGGGQLAEFRQRAILAADQHHHQQLRIGSFASVTPLITITRPSGRAASAHSRQNGDGFAIGPVGQNLFSR
jgi:hypothetical protein